MIELLTTKRVPVYIQAQQFIEELLQSDDYGPGDHIPSERTLAEELGINRMTVRKAIERLVQKGELERNGTSGTRVPHPRIARSVDAKVQGSLTRDIQLKGGVPGNKLLHFELSPANESVAKHLQIAVGTELVVIRRLWTVNSEPFCIETSHIAASRVPGLAAEDLVAGQSLYSLLDTRYGIKISHATRTISVNTTTSLEIDALRLSSNSSTLLLRVTGFDNNDIPIEYLRSVNHPTHVIFQTDT